MTKRASTVGTRAAPSGEAWRCTPGQRVISLSVRIVGVLAALVAGCAIFFFPSFAIFPAVVLIATMILSLLLDCRIGRPAAARPASTTEGEERAGTLMFIKIVVALAAGSLLITAILVGWELAGVAAIGVFLWMSLLGFPFWLAAITQSEEDEHVRMTGKHRSLD